MLDWEKEGCQVYRGKVCVDGLGGARGGEWKKVSNGSQKGGRERYEGKNALEKLETYRKEVGAKPS